MTHTTTTSISNGKSTTLYVDNGMTNVQHWTQQTIVNCPDVTTTFVTLLNTNADTQIHTINGNRAAFTNK